MDLGYIIVASIFALFVFLYALIKLRLDADVKIAQAEASKRTGKSAPRGIPRPHTPKVQLGVLTPSLLEELYRLEYESLPLEGRRDPKAKLPKGAYSYQNYKSGRTCHYLLVAIEYIRHKKGAYPLKITQNMDARLQRAIDHHKKYNETRGNNVPI